MSEAVIQNDAIVESEEQAEEGKSGGKKPSLFKRILFTLFSNALFWIFAIFMGMIGFILCFEKFTRFSVDKIYGIF